MSDSNILDKSMRSVFVGNIPYEATEEKLKDIFNEVGPVLSFKLVYDRETGKPKGYGFCEYKDQETALSAMRNLNGFEIGGRSLRVDNACTEKSRLEMQSLLAGPPVDNTYGEPVDADRAPEEISKAVASLPPEQMFELMKQMKICIQNNPAEGKQMLLQNPQLAYALLQAQVVMRIVDPQIAVTMLHKVQPALPAVTISSSTDNGRGGGGAAPQPVPSPALPLQQTPALQVPAHPPAIVQQTTQIQQQQVSSGPPAPVPVPRPQVVQEPVQTSDWIPVPPPPPARVHAPAPNSHPLPHQQFLGKQSQDMDMRSMDPRAGVLGRGLADQDLRIPPMAPPPPTIHPSFQQEAHPTVRDPRERYQRDPRTAVSNSGTPAVSNSGRNNAPQPGPLPSAVPPQRVPPPSFNPTIPTGATDQEKAALIMQVLQLSDEQIAMLPPEQRQSILVLKEQIAKSTQR